MQNGLKGDDAEGTRRIKVKQAAFYKELEVRMKQTAYSGVALAQTLELAISHVALKCFDITSFVNRLSRVKRIPKDLSDDAIQIMIKVLFKCIPMRGYDPNDLELRYNHLMAITLLTRF